MDEQNGTKADLRNDGSPPAGTEQEETRLAGRRNADTGSRHRHTSCSPFSNDSLTRDNTIPGSLSPLKSQLNLLSNDHGKFPPGKQSLGPGVGQSRLPSHVNEIVIAVFLTLSFAVLLRGILLLGLI